MKSRAPPTKKTKKKKKAAKPVAASARSTSSSRRGGDAVPALRRELDVHREELATQNDDLRRANEALLVAKERYARLYDAAPIAYFTIGGEEGTIVEVNVAGAELFEASRNFLFGRRFDEVVAPSSRASFRQFCRRVLDYGGRPAHETVLITSTRRFPARIEAARLDADGASSSSSSPSQQQCLLAISDDTHRRAEEDHRQRLERRVAESQRVESLGVLAQGVAHEMNNMLAAALAHAELVLLEEDLSKKTLESAREIRGAVLRATRLGKQMLSYSGHEHLQTSKPIDVSEMIRSMRELLTEAASKDVLTFDLAEDLPSVAAESVQLQQVVLNLVVNAAEAISLTTGRITVRTRHSIDDERSSAAPDASVEVAMGPPPSSTPRGQVLIEVIDDGDGMDEPTRLRAFDPFFTTKFMGRGLGLAVVHGSVRAHGGTVVLESRRGRGTTARISLPPASARAVAAVAAKPLPANDLTLTAETDASVGLVLVVDDDQQVRIAIGRGLERAGYEICYAHDGINALEEARRLSTARIIAVLLDVQMPRLDGAATCVALKELDRTLPVVLMSGFAGGLVDTAVLKAADAFLAKPFPLTTVLEVVRRVGRKRGSEEEEEEPRVLRSPQD